MLTPWWLLSRPPQHRCVLCCHEMQSNDFCELTSKAVDFSLGDSLPLRHRHAASEIFGGTIMGFKILLENRIAADESTNENPSKI